MLSACVSTLQDEVTFKKAKLIQATDIRVDINTKIKELGQEGVYKHLGINGGDSIQHATIKKKIKMEYYRRMGLVTKSELNGLNNQHNLKYPYLHIALTL